ncbi:glycine/betaine ABC transporter permease [Methanocalculus chunghsingensis]|uniref:Glycine/betaine ABC transporter permease n=1 Tax=Methanocalculus chunghsingensis TaxID=156457 RepID=A0A8J7W7M9_9EURY|nr:BCCT family transporter [Methanocalculus chunghsingensis]MBR1369931.1 glycine/betaine ABC transporter permease [Methanocalculus chunghsingensis]
MWNEYLKRESVFLLSAGIILFFIAVGIISPDLLESVSQAIHAGILDYFSWLYLISAFFFLIFALGIALSRYGTIKLGYDAERPQYSFFGWIAMLFAAGMGIGLIFWGVSEPLLHFLMPPPFMTSSTPEAASFAMRYVFFHWGIHPWAIYTIVSLSIAYFSFRRGMPALISSCFYPVLGERIYGMPGKLVDVLAVFATVFGTATSLGFGALQIHAGFTHLYGLSSAISVTIGIIVIATALFMASAILGVEKGVQILSKINIIIATILLLFILSLGSTPYILNIFTSTLGGYINNVIDLSLQSYPFEGYGWSRDWTIFYWAWWISWSPFVGLFIARISRGRTIREFVLTVLSVPTLFTFIWFSVFGGSALYLELERGVDLTSVAGEDVSLALFVFLEQYPVSGLLSLIVILLLIVFFVTSADSATVVLGSLTSGGSMIVPMYKKVIWGLSLSTVAIVLLLTGGLDALQMMAITAAFPFMIVMVILCYTLWVGLSQEKDRIEQ